MRAYARRLCCGIGLQPAGGNGGASRGAYRAQSRNARALREYVFDGGDSCSDPYDWWCHWQASIEYELYGAFGDYFSCPNGCRTYSIAGTYRTQYTAGLNRIKTTAGCTFARSFLNQLYNNGQIRFYSVDDHNWGDFHYSKTADGTPDYMGRVHIWEGTFNDIRELAVTLVHEAWHGMYGYDEVAAEATAQACVT